MTSGPFFALTSAAALTATIDPGATDAAREWQAYYSTWTAWHHLRTSTGVIAAVLMVAGLRYR
jgi:uncharacterized membrane protein